MFCTVKLDFWMNRNSTLKHTLLGTNISRQDGNSEDESSFPMVWFVSSLEGRFAPSAKRGLPQHGKSQAVWGWVGTIGMGGVAINKRQRGKNWSLSTNWEVFKFLVEVVLMEDILHQLIGSLSHDLQCFIHVGWCRISSINSIFSLFGQVIFLLLFFEIFFLVSVWNPQKVNNYIFKAPDSRWK